MNPYSLLVDPELEAYLPSVHKTTDDLLETNLIAAGRALEPIIVWRTPAGRTIIDGHRRYSLCKKHYLKYEIRELDFPNKDAVKEWMDKHQLQRRNLSSHDFSMVLARQLDRETKRMQERLAIGDGIGRGRPGCAGTVAKAHDVSLRTVFRAKAYAEAMEKLDIDTRERFLADGVNQLDIIRFAAQPAVLQSAIMREWDTGDFATLSQAMRGIARFGKDDDEDEDDQDARQVEPDAPERDTVSQYRPAPKRQTKDRDAINEKRREERKSTARPGPADDQHLTADEYFQELEQLLVDAQEAFGAAVTPEQIDSARLDFFRPIIGRVRVAKKRLGQVFQSEQAAALEMYGSVQASVEALLAAKTQPPVEIPPEPEPPPDRPPPDRTPLVAVAIEPAGIPFPSDDDGTAMDPEDAFRDIEEDLRQTLLKIDRLHSDTGREHPGEHGSVLRAIEGLGKSLKDWKWVVIR